MTKETFRFIYYNLIRTGYYLKATAKLSEEEVAEAARRYAIGLEWFCDENFIQQLPRVTYEDGKIVWSVLFLPLENGLPLRGGHLCILIDDETGKVIKQVAGTR